MTSGKGAAQRVLSSGEIGGKGPAAAQDRHVERGGIRARVGRQRLGGRFLLRKRWLGRNGWFLLRNRWLGRHGRFLRDGRHRLLGRRRRRRRARDRAACRQRLRPVWTIRSGCPALALRRPGQMALLDRPGDHAFQMVGIEARAVRHDTGPCVWRSAAQIVDPLQELGPGLLLAACIGEGLRRCRVGCRVRATVGNGRGIGATCRRRAAGRGLAIARRAVEHVDHELVVEHEGPRAAIAAEAQAEARAIGIGGWLGHDDPMRAPLGVDAAILESHGRVREEDAKTCGLGFGAVRAVRAEREHDARECPVLAGRDQHDRLGPAGRLRCALRLKPSSQPDRQQDQQEGDRDALPPAPGQTLRRAHGSLSYAIRRPAWRREP